MMNVSAEFMESIFKPGRKIHAKVIVHFTNSMRLAFTEKDLFSLRLLEQKEHFDGKLSAGNCGKKLLEVIFNNANRIFDKDNRHSSLYGFLVPERKVEPYLGLTLKSGEIEWVSLGIFWSGDWEAPEDKIWCKTLCVDRLALLDRTHYETGKIIPTPAVIIRTDDTTADWQQGTLYNVKAIDGKLTLNLGGS